MAEASATHPGRNEPCPCGSGKKYKHCCLEKDEEAERARLTEQAAEAQPAAPPPEHEPAPHAPPPRPAQQPWKRTAQNARGTRRVTTPRKAG
jgi:hypothetical protein